MIVIPLKLRSKKASLVRYVNTKYSVVLDQARCAFPMLCDHRMVRKLDKDTVDTKFVVLAHTSSKVRTLT